VSGRLIFLLGKDPATEHGGDMTMFSVLRAVANESFDVGVICLSDRTEAPAEDGITRVPKSTLSLPGLAARSVRIRRSLIHTRFDVPELRSVIERSMADRYVAVHSYMAEAYLGSADARPSEQLIVSAEVSESAVWAKTRGPLARFDLPRLRRDEFRVARQARSVGGYDRSEVETLRTAGARAVWLDVTLPPGSKVDVGANPPRLVLLGNRTWRPNAEAAEQIVALWPRIRAGIAGAELVLVGPRPEGAAAKELPGGVIDVGRVADVGAVLAGCRAMVAPVPVGGGVRVKVLEAAARGLPVIASSPAVGSIESVLGVRAVDDEDAFVSQARALLQDPALATEAGEQLYEANKKRWDDGVVKASIRTWLDV
jgi:glycosyltransferase involved in cell wall biosynthesis